MTRRMTMRISSKGQIVLPKSYRDERGWHEGDYIVAHELDDGTLVIEKQPPTRLEEILDEFRREARRIGYTRKQLTEDIKAARKERLKRES